VSCQECGGLRYIFTKELGPVETGVVLFPVKIEKCGDFREVLLLIAKELLQRLQGDERGCW